MEIFFRNQGIKNLSRSTVEYYVWQGIVMKRVEKYSDGTTTSTIVESIEQPTSIDASKFATPQVK